MKLDEVLDFVPRKPTKQSQEEIQDTLGTKLRKLGLPGAYGAAFELPTPVPQALKVGRTGGGKNVVDDGYLGWLNKVRKSDNPWFPQINNLRVYKTEDPNQFHYQANLEKLDPLHSMEEPEAERLFMHYLGLSDEEMAQLRAYAKKESVVLRTSLVGIYAMLFARALSDFVRGASTEHSLNGISATIRDGALQQAIGLLSELKQRGYGLDLHSKNIMMRRTPYGIQPVIVDPFEGKSWINNLQRPAK